ncbi:YbaB/EbfC family nucleoid-associated protein, partial [Candidatus Peregrinibacteria bacterium]|nr:YbaB/EbfC family nucleoid-associated protein [Candidatus Peregrinibacteria bacterium]
MLDKAKDLYKLQKQARQIKKELKKTHIEADHEGVIVVINGEQEVVNVEISDDALENKKKLEENLEKA